jgi:hypothetical protein
VPVRRLTSLTDQPTARPASITVWLTCVQIIRGQMIISGSQVSISRLWLVGGCLSSGLTRLGLPTSCVQDLKVLQGHPSARRGLSCKTTSVVMPTGIQDAFTLGTVDSKEGMLVLRTPSVRIPSCHSPCAGSVLRHPIATLLVSSATNHAEGLN